MVESRFRLVNRSFGVSSFCIQQVQRSRIREGAIVAWVLVQHLWSFILFLTSG